MQSRATPVGEATTSSEPPPGTGRTAADASRLAEAEFGKEVRSIAKRKNIVSTRSLVAVYNQTRDEFDRRILYRWLSFYHKAFQEKRSNRWAGPEVALEYGELAHVAPNGILDKELLTTMVKTLKGELRLDDTMKHNAATALNQVLQTINPRVFKDGSEIMDVAEEMIRCLNTGQQIRKYNFHTHGQILFALHQMLVILSSLPRNTVRMDDKNVLRKNFKTKRREIAQDYYPVTHQLDLIAHSIERIQARVDDEGIGAVMEFLGTLCCGLLHCFKGWRKVVEFDFDPEAIEKGTTYFQRVLANKRTPERRWYEMYLTLRTTAWLSLMDDTKQPIFIETLRAAINWQETEQNTKERKALRFGIVHELCRVGEHGLSAGSREAALEELLSLAAIPMENGAWIRDQDILEAVFDSLHAVYQRLDPSQKELEGKIEDSVKKAIEIAAKDVARNRAVNDWLSGNSPEDKLRREREGKLQRSFELFSAVRKKAGLTQSVKEMRDNVQDLKRYYKDEPFAMVTIKLFPNSGRRHVKNMNYDIAVYDAVARKEELEKDSANEEGPRAIYREQKKQQARKSLALEDLFPSTSLDSNNMMSDTRKVLMFGNPGTGKTCLSKSIAYDWACGKYGQEFEVVYVLPVKEIKEKRHGKYMDGRGEIEAAIVDVCFSPRYYEGASFENLWTQVDNDLDSTATLLILDGLDEGDAFSRKCIESALKRQCNILMLSRPFSLYNIRKEVDAEVECRGFNDAQLVQFITAELPYARNHLLRFLQTNVATWEIAHVPVMAQILCLLWKEQEQTRESRENAPRNQENDYTSSISKVYSDMALYVWSRYNDKTKESNNVNREDFFRAMGEIAYESFDYRGYLVSQATVNNQANTDGHRSGLRGCGFLLLPCDNTYYHFFHRRYQEFFAGRWLARGLETSSHTARDFLAYNKYKPKYKMITSIMAEEFCDRDMDALDKMLTIADKGKLEAVGIQHLCAKLRLVEAAFSIGKTTLYEQRGFAGHRLVESVSQLIRGVRLDSRLRQAVVSHLREMPTIVKDFASLVDPLAELLEESPTDANLLSQVIPIIEHVPARLERVLENLKTNSADQNSEVRVAAMEQTAAVINAAPGTASKLLNLLEGGLEIEAEDAVREAAIRQLASIDFSSSQTANRLADIVKKTVNDPQHSVRAVAVGMIPRMMLAYLEEAEEYLELLAKRAADPHEKVRVAAIDQITEILSMHPEKHESLFQMLNKGSQDEYQDVRASAVRQAARFVSEKPDYVEALLQMIEKGATRDELCVRAAALHQFDLIVSAVPENTERVLDIILAALRDSHEEVQDAAMQQIANVAHVIPPDKAIRLSEIQESVSRDLHPDVGHGALEQQFQEIASASAEEIEGLSQVLAEALADNDDDVRTQANRILETLHLKELLKIHWAFFQPLVVKEIAYRLVECPVAFSNLRDGRLRLAADSGFVETVFCERPIDDVRGLLQLVEGILEDIYPDLYQIPPMASHRQALLERMGM